MTLMAVACRETRLKPSFEFVKNLAVSEVAADHLPWFALQVRTRREASVSAYLRGMGYEDFFPTQKNRTRRSDGVTETNASLFPGYLFCRFNPQNRLPILKTPGVIQVVSNSRSPIPVSDSEIEALKVASASGTHCEPWPYLEVGEIVRIETGPLRGCRGILVDFRGGQHLILSVNLLQRSVAVAIEASAVRLEQQLVGEFA